MGINLCIFLVSPFFLLAAMFHLLFYFPLKSILAFVGAAVSNDMQVFYDELSEWNHELKEGWDEHWRFYQDLWSWLMKGSKKKNDI